MQHSLADALYGEIPADVGSKGSIALEAAQYGAMLMGARWALEQGWGEIVISSASKEGGVACDALPGWCRIAPWIRQPLSRSADSYSKSLTQAPLQRSPAEMTQAKTQGRAWLSDTRGTRFSTSASSV